MNSPNQVILRLLDGAARAPRPTACEVPLTVQYKVLAHWRGLAAAPGDIAHLLFPLLRRAALCACLLMLLSIVFGYHAILSGDVDEMTLANSAVDLTLLP